MNFKSIKQSDLENYIVALKLLATIAVSEIITIVILEQFEFKSPAVEMVLDTTFLVLLSGISIWHLIIVPYKKSILKNFQNSIKELGHDIHAIDHIAIISSTDLNGKITYVNDVFCKISGYTQEELIGQNHRLLNSGLHPKEFFKEMWDLLKAGKSWRGQIRNKKKNGEFFWVSSYNIPVFNKENKICKFVSFRFDITAEKIAEEAFEQEKIKSLHMGRLSLIGEMAGGIAHEINNPLTIIKGAVSLISRKLQDPNHAEEIPKILEGVGKIQNQVNRMSKMIIGLRNFSRSGDNQIEEIISVNKIFASVEDLCIDKLKTKDVRFSTLSLDLEFQCNTIQIEQVIVNLINNAIDAIACNNERWIKLEATRAGGFLEISVTDSGFGIPEDIAKKIMQPFFTTKEIGKGTGLGLSISIGIIENHGGKLFLDSQNCNTRFVIQIPVDESSLMALINADEAINNELEWKHELLQLFADKNNIPERNVESDGLCAIGKWINRIESRFKNNTLFIELKTAHSDFHKHAGEIVRNACEQNFAITEHDLGPGSIYDEKSHRLIAAMLAFCDSKKSA